MKKFNIFKNLTGLSTLIFAFIFMASIPASADMVSNAGLIPAGYGYTHGRIPVVEATGKPEIHDAAIMRYDKNSRIRDIDGDTTQNANYTQTEDGVRRKDF